ncbi:Hpt domain-containing protein [Labilibaculum sp.]|uniref:Hpt domain-containing protein n=1 Tax=Labilibaculum sp. TaxID=2060723 RepID=UPI002AA60C49|nr:Hpt domain-containing protein [Labilibaculum sp.]MBN2597613.1 Hpt domain-containing protein [Marinifilaceae bacterium]
MNQINFKNCNTGQEAVELIIEENFDLIISKYQLDDQNAIELNQSVESVKNYCTNTAPKNNKLLIITTNPEEEQLCKDNEILFFPENLNLKSLIIKLIDLPRDIKRGDKKDVIINFNDLFKRVDNNREFIQTVIEKFFEIWESRINDIQTPLNKGEFKLAKDAAHKLKGVLANFSMEVAKTTIIELEKHILDNDQELSLQKLDQLITDIENAHKFYLDKQDQFRS